MDNTKILSWDVGIKNLAYCLLEKKDDDFEIIKWGVINLVDDRQKCQYVIKNKNTTCNDVAKTCIYHTDKISLFGEKDVMFSCSKHKDKLFPNIIELSDEKTNNKKNKKNKKNKDIEENIICNKCNICDEKSKYSLTGTTYGWCDKHYEKKGESFVKKIKAKRVTVVSCNKQPLQELSEKLFGKLDKEFNDFMHVDKVLIENQPSLRNPSMKTISSMLYSYFVMRGIIDSNITKSNITEIRFVSPSNKLKIDINNTNEILNKEKEKSKVYKMTKKLGVKYCKALINEKDSNTLDAVKKKDDMCDAFLQGIQYLFNPLPEKFFKKLQVIGFEDDKKTKTIKK